MSDTARFKVVGQPNHEHQTQRVIGSLVYVGSGWVSNEEWFECPTCGWNNRYGVTQ